MSGPFRLGGVLSISGWMYPSMHADIVPCLHATPILITQGGNDPLISKNETLELVFLF
jgi:predicted esterase